MASFLLNSSGLAPTMPQYVLPPDQGYQLAISTYLAVGCLSILIWDLIHSLNGDYKLLFQHKLGLPTLAYFTARLSAFGYILVGVLFQTMPLGKCYAWQRAHCALYAIAVPSCAFLFLARVGALYYGHHYITGFFCVLWLAVVGGAITLPIAITATTIKNTNFCINAKVESYSTAASICPLVFDALVFIAISWKLTLNAYNTNPRDGVKTFFLGKSLPAFSKTLLHDGQKYYLATVVVNLICVGLLFAGKNVPVLYKSMAGHPNVLIISVTACKVYRNTKLGIYRETTLTVSGGTHTARSVILPVFRQSPYYSSTELGSSGTDTEVKMKGTGTTKRCNTEEVTV